MKNSIAHTHHGYPDRRFSHLVFYVVRPAAHPAGPLRLEEWLAYVDRSPDLVLDEVYTRYNINREREETWREPGCAQWDGPEEAVHFHFRPAGVGVLSHREAMDGKTSSQRIRLVRALPDDPVIDDWVRIVGKSRYMEMEPGQGEPRRAWWVGRDGGRKALMNWEPPAIWIYRMPVQRFHDENPKSDPARRARCEQIARDLGARVETLERDAGGAAV